MNIAIRPLHPDDWQAFREIRLAALLDAPTAFGSTYAETIEYREETWRSRLTTARMFAATNGDELVGLVGGLPTADPHMVLLISMWVAPCARKHGVGEQLVRRVQQWAKEQGCTKLRLWVTIGNTPAERLYDRLGFIKTGLVDQSNEHFEAEMECTL